MPENKVIMPHKNVFFAYIAGFLSYLILQYAKKEGYDVPEYVADGLPAAITAIAAHGWDMAVDWIRRRAAIKPDNSK